MSIAEKLITVAENVPKVYKAGQKSEYDRFWDDYQQNGNRTSYGGAFAGEAWTTETFKPKYNLIVKGNANRMFELARLQIDLGEYLNSLGVTLDLSGVTQFNNAFYYARFTKLPVIDLSGLASATNVFNAAHYLEEIEKLVVNENTAFTSWFYSCAALKEIRFEGTIGKSIDMHWSTGLSYDSVASIFECLGGSASATLSLPTSHNDGRYDSLIADKLPSNWAVSWL